MKINPGSGEKRSEYNKLYAFPMHFEAQGSFYFHPIMLKVTFVVHKDKTHASDATAFKRTSFDGSSFHFLLPRIQTIGLQKGNFKSQPFLPYKNASGRLVRVY